MFITTGLCNCCVFVCYGQATVENNKVHMNLNFFCGEHVDIASNQNKYYSNAQAQIMTLL
jgi:hypothetical protein